MNEKTPVIGFDLGHGESSLAILDDAYDNERNPDPRPIFTVKSQPTVLARLQDGRKVWGWNAYRQTLVRRDQVSEFEICFKAKPGGEHTDAVIQEFATCVLGDACAELNGMNSRTRWFIGCPSAWDSHAQTRYARIFSQVGFGAVAIVKESRAAFTYHFEKNGGVSIIDLQKPTVVLDFGSSTLDATLAIGLRDDELDPGCPLGATWIDKAILHWNLKHCSLDGFPGQKSDGEKIATFLAANRFDRNQVELEVRKAKEVYFNGLDNNLDENWCYEHPAIKFQGHKLWIVLYGEMMHELMNTRLEEVVPELQGDGVPDDVRAELIGHSWLGRCRKFLEDIGSKLEARGIKRADVRHVLLTGGASRMQLVRRLVREFFGAGQMLDGEGKVQYDTEPEMCIARGLARWGRTAVRGEAFRDEVSTLLFGKFMVTDEALVEMRKASVPDPVIAKVGSLKSLPAEKCYPAAFHPALAATLGEDDEKHHAIVIDKTPLVDHRLFDMIFTQCESAKFEEIVGQKAGDVILWWLRDWHNGNSKASRLGPNIAQGLRRWSESGELLKEIRTRVERFESAIRKQVNDIVKPVMATYHISDVTFMEQTDLFDKFAEYYKSGVELLAKELEKNAPFEGLNDSWWTRWMEYTDSDILGFVRKGQGIYASAIREELYGHADNVQVLVASIYVPVTNSVERAITATQYLINADMKNPAG